MAKSDDGSQRPELKNWEGLKKAFREDLSYPVQAALALWLNATLALWGIFVFQVAGQGAWYRGCLTRVGVESSEGLTLVLLALAGGAVGGIIYGMQKLWQYATKGKFNVVYSGDYIFRQFGAAAIGAVVYALVSSGFIAISPGLQAGGTATATPAAISTPAPEGAATALPEALATEPAAAELPEETAGAETPAGETETGAGVAEAETGEEQGGPEAEEPPAPPDMTSAYFAFGLGVLSGFGSYQVTRKMDEIIKVIFGRLTKDDLDEGKQ